MKTKRTLKPIYTRVPDVPNAPTRPYGIPVDDTEFKAFLEAGNFTSDQVRTLRQMVAQMEAVDVSNLPQEVKDATQANIDMIKAAVESYPPDAPTNLLFNP